MMAVPGPLLTIHTVCYNEESMLPLFVSFYKSRFPDVVIIVHDNESTDNTAKVAKALGCTVLNLDTNGMFHERLLKDRRSQGWKLDRTNSTWVLVVDVDEICDITVFTLLDLARKGICAGQGTGYEMVGMDNGETEPANMMFGYSNFEYDKPVLFQRESVEDVEFSFGSHSADFTFQSSCHFYSSEIKAEFNLFHYNMVSPSSYYTRKMNRATRRDPSQPGWVDLQGQFNALGLETIQARFDTARSKAVQVIPDLHAFWGVATNLNKQWTQYAQGIIAAGEEPCLPRKDMFVFVPYVDGYGEDECRLTSQNPGHWKSVTASKKCVAVNTLGFIKRSISQVGFSPWFPFENPEHGLWVTDEEYAGNPAFDAIKKVLSLHAKTVLCHGSMGSELVKQYMSARAINPTDVVLELDGNVGRNSLIIASLLADDSNLVTLESNPEHAEQLFENHALNKQHFSIVSVPRELPCVTWSYLQAHHPLNFNVLVADSKGPIVTMLEAEPQLLSDFTKLLVEHNGSAEASDLLRDTFTRFGFKRTFEASRRVGAHIIQGYGETWSRSAL